MSIPYTLRMRPFALIGHFLLLSLPLLGLLMALHFFIGPETQVTELFRHHKWQHPDFQDMVRFVTDWGNPVLYVPFAIMFLRGRGGRDPRRARYALTWLVVQLVICFAVLNLTKMALGRPRPETGGELYHFLTLDPRYHSLPSGHTAEITGSCLALALWLKSRRATLALGLVVAVLGFSRIYLNMHYPSDVFFGWLFGSLAGWTTYVFGRGKESPHHG